VTKYLEGAFDKPVVAQSDLSEHYDISLRCEAGQDRKQIFADELAQAGLELISTNMPIEMLVVEKVKWAVGLGARPSQSTSPAAFPVNVIQLTFHLRFSNGQFCLYESR
jgi:uncharacterized protein DUF3738